jgi:uncharacterized protein (DUF305 family)
VRRLALLVAAVIAVVLLVGCSDEGSPAATSATTSGADHNEADVDFATGMIPHHAQAIRMVEMGEGRGTSPEFRQLLADIEDAQVPEIEQMTGWLEDWGEEVPPTAMGMGQAHGSGGSSGHGMGHGDPVQPGMMGARDLDRLDTTQGAGFERMWMRMMIEHHEGAIEMAETEERLGKSPDALDLAADIIEAQQAEIELMEDLIRR